MAAEVGNSYSPGRPSEYKPEFDEQAFKLCLLGLTDSELATYFDVAESTINNWKIAHPSFLESVTRGKDIADAEVANSLYKRAIGYEFNEVTFEKIDSKVMLEITPDVMVTEDAYKKKVVTKHLPGDPGAAMNWLKNRQKTKWRDKQDVELSGKDGGPIETKRNYDDLTDEELQAIVARGTRKE